MSKKKKLKIIIDPSESYRNELLSQTIKEWGELFVKRIEEFEFPLNGFEKYYTCLDLSDKNKLKKFVEFLPNLKGKDFIGEGLVILAEHKQGSTKIIKVVEENKGEVIQKKNSTSAKEDLLNELHLTKEQKDFLSLYTGEDYEILVMFKKSVEKIDNLNRLPIQDLYTYLPKKEGALQPWIFVDELIQKQPPKKVLKSLERTLIHTHPLVCLSILQSKFRTLFWYKIAQENNISTKEFGIDKWKTKGFDKLKISSNDLMLFLVFLKRIESEMKGELRVPIDLHFVNSVHKICLRLR